MHYDYDCCLVHMLGRLESRWALRRTLRRINVHGWPDAVLPLDLQKDGDDSSSLHTEWTVVSDVQYRSDHTVVGRKADESRGFRGRDRVVTLVWRVLDVEYAVEEPQHTSIAGGIRLHHVARPL